MSLRRLEVRDFRCIAATDLEFDGRCNLISGANASGKTSLLEAIFFLGRGRSFRTARNETLIRKGAAELLLTGRFEAGESVRPVGVRYSREGFEAGPPAIGSAAWRSWRRSCRCRRSILKSIGWWKRGRRSAAATWTGECSTWNHGSWTSGAVTNGR